jgi:hypothetical protein
MVQVAHQDGVLCLVQQLSLFPNLLLSAFALSNVTANRDVLVGLSRCVEKRNYRGINPIVTAILRAVLYLTAPDFAACYRGPKDADEVLWVISRVDDAMILTE